MDASPVSGVSMFDFALLGVAAFTAGLVDAVVGGGGLIQLPVLFSLFPREAPATLIGTSKLAGVKRQAPRL